MKANREPSKFKTYTIERGQCIIGRKTLQLQTGISEQSIRTALERLKSTNEVTIKTTNKFSIITICNYDKYQDKKENINQQIKQASNQQLTNKQPTTNQQLTTSLEVKKIKNKDIVELIINYLNLKTETSFKTTSKNTIALINARLNEDYTVEQFYKVIDIKTEEWLNDSKMAKFLRPKTLFSSENFDGYLNQKKNDIPKDKTTNWLYAEQEK